MKIVRLIICGFILFISINGFAQAPFQGGIHFNIGLPQGEFSDNVDNIGLGFSGYFGYHFYQTPIILGGSFSYLVYGSETREEPWSQTIPDVFVDVTTTNSIIRFYLMLRLQPQKGKILPYLDGLAGFNYLRTDTKVEDQNDYEEIASSKALDDITFSYGVGGGLLFQVYDGSSQQNHSGLDGVYIDLGFRYTKGGEAEYLKKGSIEIAADNSVIYNISKSTTDLIAILIGATLTFKPVSY